MLMPSLEELRLPPEILEAAAEIADASDAPGIEPWRLEFLVRFVVWAERQFCGASRPTFPLSPASAAGNGEGCTT